MNNEEILKSRIFTRRALIMGISKISLLSLLIGRLYYLQIIKSKDYKTLSENNSLKSVFIKPLRGDITDRNQIKIATNRNKYRVMIENKSKDFKNILDELLKLLNIEQEEKKLILQRLSDQKRSMPHMVHSHLSWEEVANIESNSYRLPGVYIETIQERTYPFAQLCANILGYIAPANESEISEEPILKYQDIKVGKNGMEKIFDRQLRGEFGVKRVEVNAHGLNVREISVEDAIEGKSLTSSIDIHLQEFVADILSQHSGSVVVMDIETGEILSMNSSPSYDPNIMVDGISKNTWAKLLNNSGASMINKAVSNHYPPGSIFKLIVSAASLNEKISPDELYDCKGFVTIGNRKFHCWKEHGHGEVNMTQAISQSCNCYFFNLAKRIGIDNIAQMARIFGFGAKTNIELPNEITGLIPDAKWKLSKVNKVWTMGDTINASIGQGYVLATPIQLAIAVARIASGKNICPTLVVSGNKDRVFEDLAINDNYLKAIRLGMYKTINDPMGTSYNNRLIIDGFEIAGKTSTAQVISKRNEHDDFSNKSTILKHRNHGLFAAFAPYHKPKYACSIVIEHGLSGAAGAGPVAKAIFLELKRRFF